MAIVRIIDIETAAGPPDKPDFTPQAICEVAFLDYCTESDVVLGVFQTLVNTPIPAKYQGMHQITPEMVADAPTLEEVHEIIAADYGVPDAHCAHQAKFEEGYLSATRGRYAQVAVPWICTWKGSVTADPDLDSHSNQALRYHYREPLWDHPCMDPPHRALPDVNVTLCHLRRLLRSYTVEQLIDITNKPVLLKEVKFGKHYGKLWADMDTGFYDWVLKNDFDEDTMYTARHWKEQRRVAPAQPFDPRKE